MTNTTYTLGIDIGSTTVKIAILDDDHKILFSDYERHYANIQETLASLLEKAEQLLGDMYPASGHHRFRWTDTGQPSGSSIRAGGYRRIHSAAGTAHPKTDVAIELGGEDAKIIYFEGGNVEQRMNGICAGGTGSFIDQMASLLTDRCYRSERICQKL